MQMIVITPGGTPLALQEPPTPELSVAALRDQVAAVLGVHRKKVRLLHEGQDLTAGGKGGLQLCQALGGVQGSEHVTITAVISQLNLDEMKEHITVHMPGMYDCTGMATAYKTMDWVAPRQYGFCGDSSGHIKSAILGATFPKAADININMLPFIIGDQASVPEEYQQYWSLIQECCIPHDEHGKVGYLTVQESLVPQGQCQRRPGVHIEMPGLVMSEDGKYHEHPYMWGCGLLRVYDISQDHDPDLPRVEGGIYMANSVKDSCMLWDAVVDDPGLVVGPLGDLEHARGLLGKGSPMRHNTIYWLTDRTPHETLPMKQDTYRQFFRVVTSKLSAWFPEHSTTNRLGVKPDPEITKVIEGSKFTY